MMTLQDLIIPECIHTDVQCQSKKRVLEKISEYAASHCDANARDIFTSLLEREKLGSTSIGQGIALPHGRIPKTQTPFAVVLKLKEPISFDDSDPQPVDLIFALLIPEENQEESLEVLTNLARRMTNKDYTRKLRHAESLDVLTDMLQQL